MGKLYLDNKEIILRSGPFHYIEKVINAQGKLVQSSNKLDFTGVSMVSGYMMACAYRGAKNITGVGCPNATDLKILNADHAFDGCFWGTNITATGLSNVEKVVGTACFIDAFRNTKIVTLDFDNLKEVSGTSAFTTAFCDCKELIDGSFPNLEIISGSNSFQRGFEGCTNLVSFSFPKLHTVTGQTAFMNTFMSCTNLEHIYFPALTTSSFGTNKRAFEGMLIYTGTAKTHTIHFPSNLESTIQTLTNYPNFSGTNGYVVLAYDLPATS